ncbi:hypothetical protein PR048_015427 [Dryococelus australis]|uniref:Uncharacterized protein n=1 Tax=Dryococelus australis TaxID=614101 RepID=A0ABQ9HHY3_9NEOP|nr:hypothetical protein PR048_015427 [Dryococelus australis]
MSGSIILYNRLINTSTVLVWTLNAKLYYFMTIPQDKGILRSLRCLYRKAFLQLFLSSLNGRKIIAEIKTGYNLRDHSQFSFVQDLAFIDETEDEESEVKNFTGFDTETVNKLLQ